MKNKAQFLGLVEESMDECIQKMAADDTEDFMIYQGYFTTDMAKLMAEAAVKILDAMESQYLYCRDEVGLDGGS